MLICMIQGLKVMMTSKIKYVAMVPQLYPVLSVVACCCNANCDVGKTLYSRILYFSGFLQINMLNTFY